MTVSRHLGFYRTGSSVIRSVDPENPGLEPNMEWIGCTVCEISAFKVLYCDLETGVRGHSRLRNDGPRLSDISRCVSRFDTNHAWDRRTERQTDRHTDGIGVA